MTLGEALTPSSWGEEEDMEIQRLPQGWGARPGPRPHFNPLIHTATTQVVQAWSSSGPTLWSGWRDCWRGARIGREMDGETEAEGPKGIEEKKSGYLLFSPAQPDIPGAPRHDLSRGHPATGLQPQPQES